MSDSKAPGAQVDELMEMASKALVKRDYFAVERACVEAMSIALAAHDYQRAARILLPLEEARRQKRDIAVDTGRVSLIIDPLGEAPQISPGCYVLCPPRVAQEARQMREAADAAEVPIVVIAREPATRNGLVPIVAVGGATFRAYVTAPEAEIEPKPKKKKPAGKKPAAEPASNDIKNVFGHFVTPSVAWVLAAAESLGDAAIAEVVSPDPVDQITELWLRLQTFPDHEKLHQRLMEACAEAARIGVVAPKPRPVPQADPDDEFAEDEDIN